MLSARGVPRAGAILPSFRIKYLITLTNKVLSGKFLQCEILQHVLHGESAFSGRTLGSELVCAASRQTGAGRDRRATQPPAHFHRNPLGRGRLAVFPRCSLDPYDSRYGRFARALKNSQLTSGKLPAISGTGH